MSIRFERASPILPVRDVRAALAHYEALGFKATPFHEDDGLGLLYGFIERDDVELHLVRVLDLDPRTNTSAVYVYVDDADALYEQWKSAVTVGRLEPPVDTPYGLRELAHVDADGNLLRVGSPLRGC